jgi:phosphohistidine phosphatase
MKTLYFIRHAKSNSFAEGESDFERTLSSKGIREIKTIGSYLRLRGVSPDAVLSSCALRAQETSMKLMENLEFKGKISYFEQLYMTTTKEIIEIIKMQEDSVDSMFIIGHHPYLTELINQLSNDHISKIPSMGVVCVNFKENEWQNIEDTKGDVDYFIFPKQFQYYMPKQIRISMNQD